MEGHASQTRPDEALAQAEILCLGRLEKTITVLLTEQTLRNAQRIRENQRLTARATHLQE